MAITHLLPRSPAEAAAASVFEHPATPVRAPDLLRRSGSGLLATAFVLACFAYGVVESLVGDEAYAAGVPWLLMLVPAMVAATCGALLAQRVGLRRAEKTLLPLLLALATAFAAYPGIIRINGLTASYAPTGVLYEQQADLVLQPMMPGPPALRIARYDWYWHAFVTGEVHLIRVRQGGLGVWVYDAAGLREQISNQIEGDRE